MEQESGGKKSNEQLLSEREAIMRQLAMLGSGPEDLDVDDEEEDEEEEVEKMEEGVEETMENASVVKETTPVKDENIVEDSNSSEELFPYLDSPPEDKIQEISANDTEIDQIDSPIRFEGVKNPAQKMDVDGEEGTSTDARPVSGSSGSSVGEQIRAPVPVLKTIMDRIDLDKSNPLPEGWTVISHQSGMPVYYHKFTRVVTHSKPYLVEGIVRDHEIPVSSIPCLYKKIMDELHENVEKQSSKCPMTYEESQSMLEIPVKELRMSPDRYQKYCEKRFKFKQITVHRYINPAEKEGVVLKKRMNTILKKRGFDADYDQLKKNNKPGDVLLSSSTGAILIDLTPCPTNINKRSGSKKPYLLNPMGKTTVAVLNEFVQRLAKGTLLYEIEDTRNIHCPYKATALLTMKMCTLREMAGQCKESLVVLSEIAANDENSTTYSQGLLPDLRRFPVGSGVGANKKTARLVAARDALLKLIPKLRVSEDNVCDGMVEEDGTQQGFEELFKKVKIDSPNLVQMCTQCAIPKPYNLLRDAVSRSLRWNGMELVMKKEMIGNGSQLSKVILILGDIQEEAEAVGVKQATQMASQRLFKKMHPELLTYGSFLEIYGRLDDKSKIDNAKKQHDEVVRLPDTGNLLAPNFIVLSKLSEEMKNISLVYPPRKFLYGLATNSTGIKHDIRNVLTQTLMATLPPPPPQFFPMIGGPPLMHPTFSTSAPPPPPPPQPMEYGYNPMKQMPSRKRGRHDDSSSPSHQKPHK
ncbi:DRBM domain-containing protein [Caenorhabditis elegans]|uniref:DRBM domain-containing protein n=2 Tax=Caenorhabditis elegans TaxID=6239 RepID=U4PRH5_CAEEL|nr:DRBM domain-containing protein [Caenorhabditis elegans]CDH93180.1 DRBM domain-containing protein [Caenorhabditis elegans]|eukprot:NP_001293461.1 PArtner of DroSHa (DRSH-1 interactor) [Caenorhabditis elegans]